MEKLQFADSIEQLIAQKRRRMFWSPHCLGSTDWKIYRYPDNVRIIHYRWSIRWQVLRLNTLINITHWGRVTHICVNKLTIIGSDNGLSTGRLEAIICTNDGIWLFPTLGTNFSEILSEILTFSFKKMHLKVSSMIWRLFCLGLSVLTTIWGP